VSGCILLVEDVEDNRALARLLLESSGFRVVEAVNGQQGVDLARELLPELVLMDLSLPGLDGFEATRRLRADAATAGLVVVAVTAHAMAGDRERALASGFDGYITKPIDVGTFVTQVKGYLGRL
jgi:two-component system cell cycle response regulator DivK